MLIRAKKIGPRKSKSGQVPLFKNRQHWSLVTGALEEFGFALSSPRWSGSLQGILCLKDRPGIRPPQGAAQGLISALRAAPRSKDPCFYKRGQGWLAGKAAGHRLHEVRDPALCGLGPEERGELLEYQL